MVQTLSSRPVQIGSMEIFWTLIEPILGTLPARRVCEIGVAEGAFTARLLPWCQERDCAYVGIDPKMSESAARLESKVESKSDCKILEAHSLAALPTLDRCDAYFLDGDHNFFTVRNELALIVAPASEAAGCQPCPIVFVHDVAWPWGRRDMYYLPTAVPAEARHPWSETLGVALDREELVDGGLREPGRYAISVSNGGPCNGVLTAVEDFLAAPEGAGWSAMILPVAYGLAVLYQPADPFLTAACREKLQTLQRVAETTGSFLQACEHNYLRLFLHGEHVQHLAASAARDLQREGAAHYATLAAYADLDRAYGELLAHSRALEGEYSKLLQIYRSLQEKAQRSPVMVDATVASAHTS